MGLTEKRMRFAEEYAADFDAARAYRAAYPAVKSDEAAAAGAERLLRREDVRRCVRDRLDSRRRCAPVGQDEVVRGLKEIAFPADPGSVTVRERLRALEILGRHLGLFTREKDDGAEKTLTVRFEGTEECEM